MPYRAGFRHCSIQPLQSVAVIVKRQHNAVAHSEVSAASRVLDCYSNFRPEKRVNKSCRHPSGRSKLDN